MQNEKKKQERKEQLISELTQNNKDLKQFSYITSHNLRAPISNLTGLLNLRRIYQSLILNLQKFLMDLKSTNLLNETINDLTKVMIMG
jgi:light-regulated signal transduction histidine kinase (bacteriophytochrome)